MTRLSLTALIFFPSLSLEKQHNSSPDLYIAFASFHCVNNMADFKYQCGITERGVEMYK